MTSKTSGLVDQLQIDAMNSAVPITDLLRKAKTVAIKLKQTDLADWIEHETSGYPAGVNVPDYRLLSSRLKFLNPVRGWCPIVGEGTNAPFPYRGSLATVQSLLEGDGDFTAPVPNAVVEKVSYDLGFTVDVRRQIGRAGVAAIADSVRNVIHDWALKLEQAGIHGEGISFSQGEAQKAQSVVINIGSIGNATGLGAFGDNASITANQSIDIKQLAQEVRSLVDQVEKALSTSGLAKDVQLKVTKQLVELKAAAAGAKPNEGRIRKGLTALKGTMENAAGGIISSGVVALIVKLLSG